MAYQPGDGKYRIIWKLVESVGGTPAQGDPLNVLLGKYLTAVGGTYRPGDHFIVILANIVRAKGGTPRPGDHEWDLLVKWLQAEGECRACGDSIHDLWKKVLALGESEPEPTPPEVRVQDGGTGITDGQVSAIEFGAVCQSLPALTKTFTVFNDGEQDLTTSGLTVPTGYTVTNPLAATIPGGGSDTFTVEVASNQDAGNYSGTISFNTNDASEPVFNFPVNADIANPLQIDTAFADSEIPWQGNLAWFWGGDVCPVIADPVYFGIEVDQDGGGFGANEFIAGSERSYIRPSDGSPHTWVFRIAAFDGDFIRLTEWVESEPFIGA